MIFKRENRFCWAKMVKIIVPSMSFSHYSLLFERKCALNAINA